MTREEAITTLAKIQKLLAIYPKRKKQKETVNEIDTAIGMAIEALSADTVSREEYEEVKAYMDTLVDAFIEDGEELAESVKVVRCKDCRHYKKINPKAKSGMCYKDIVASAWNDDGFCSRGERKGGDSE